MDHAVLPRKWKAVETFLRSMRMRPTVRNMTLSSVIMELIACFFSGLKRPHRIRYIIKKALSLYQQPVGTIALKSSTAMKYAQTVLAMITASCTAVVGYEAPLVGADNPNAIPGSYYISLRGPGDCTLEQHFQRIGVSRTDKYFNNIIDFHPLLRSYAGDFPPAELRKIRADDCVSSVCYDTKMTTSFTDDQVNQTMQGLSDRPKELWKRQSRAWTKEQQQGAPWNLGVISAAESSKKRVPPLDFSEPFGAKYDYEENSGNGVDIYIVEGSFSLENPEFEGRASRLGQSNNPGSFSSMHSSCVASIAAGKRFGVAKRANLISVAPTSISTAHVMEALAQVLLAHNKKVHESPEGFRGSIINLSLMSMFAFVNVNEAFLDIVRVAKALDEAGVLLVSGPPNLDHVVGTIQMWEFPCQMPGVICAASIGRNCHHTALDEPPLKRLGYTVSTGHGPAIALWAPGVDIPCSINIDGSWGSFSRWRTRSGTSLAIPHVVGVAALFLGYESPRDTTLVYDTVPVRKFLMGNAHINKVYLSRMFTPNRNLLLNTGINSVAEDSPQPFKGPSSPQMLLSLIKNDIYHRVVDSYIPPGIRNEPTCFKQGSKSTAAWINAQELYLRLLWERAHLNFYDPRSDDPIHGPGYDKPIPCYADACIYLFFKNVAEREPIMFMPADVLAHYTLRIITHCTDEKAANDDGVGVMVGGEMDMTELGYLGLTIRIGSSK